MSVEIAWKQNFLVTDFHLLKSLLVVFAFGSQAFVCGFSRQNINSVILVLPIVLCWGPKNRNNRGIPVPLIQKGFQPIVLIIIPKGLVDMVIYADSISVFLVEMRKQFDDFFSFFSGGNPGIPLSIGYTMGPKYFSSHI